MTQGSVLRNHPAWKDIKAIINTTDRVMRYDYAVTIHTAKEDFPILGVTMMEHNLKYLTDLSEYYVLHGLIGAGDYSHRLYPNRDHLECSVKFIRKKDNGDLDPKYPPITIRFKAHFRTDKMPRVDGDSLAQESIETMNKLSPVDLVLELQDRSEELLRRKRCDGVYPNVSMEDLMRVTMKYESEKAKVDGKPLIDKIVIYPPDNTARYPNIVLPADLMVMDLPGWIQEHGKGLYYTGMGSFFQRVGKESFWFVFPSFQPKRYTEPGVKLLLYHLQPSLMPAAEHTWRQDGEIISILSTGGTGKVETSFSNELNDGTGFRMPDGEAFATYPATVTPTGVKAQRSRLVHEFSSYDRKDGLTNANVQKSTANVFHQASKNLSYQNDIHFLTWEDSDPGLLYPGMPVRLKSWEQDQMFEQDGNLIFAYTVTTSNGNPVSKDNVYTRRTQLGIRVKRRDYNTITPSDRKVYGQRA